MKVHGVKIRCTHSYSYRCGEWALVVGVVFAVPDGGLRRLCYLVQYPDGLTDMIVVEHAADYELSQQ